MSGPQNPRVAQDLIKRLREYRSLDEWGDKIHHVICDEAAASLTAAQAEIEALKRSGKAFMDQKRKEAAEARLWFDKAQEWKAELAASKAREAALVEALGGVLKDVWDDWHSNMTREQFEQHFAEAFAALTKEPGA